MRKHDVRKWLHAILDLLPVILIPVFMIYSHRHTIDSYEVQYAQNEVVDFNQNFSNEQDGSSIVNGLTVSRTSDIFYVIGSTSESGYQTIISRDLNTLTLGHKYYLRTNYIGTTLSWSTIMLYANYNGSNFSCENNDNLFTCQLSTYLQVRLVTYVDSLSVNCQFVFNLFDLTQMFGSGNEPTIQQFNSYFPNDYYEYTTSKKVLLKDVNTVTYNDTDIGSQFMYCLYNSVDKYFNLNNVFNFQNVYDWFMLNIFGGNAPLIVPIVWNIILYEFIMDILFLTYAVFMFIIDFAEHFMDSCFTRSYRGGTRK